MNVTWLLFCFVLICSLTETASVSFGALSSLPAHAIISSTFRATEENTIFKGIKKNLNILKNGVVDMGKNLKEGNKLRKIAASHGVEALTYSEFKLLEQVKHDLMKTMRILMMLPLAPQYFFFSYVVGPMMSRSPWAWSALPSTFDDAQNAATRQQSLVKRRIQTIISSLHTLRADTIDDKDATLRTKRNRLLSVIEGALKQTNMMDALNGLRSLILMNPKKANHLSIDGMPPSIVRDCIRSFGVDGVPSWLPLVRLANIAELRKYFERLQKSDKFLQSRGIKDMSVGELELACFERYVPAIFARVE